MVGRCRCDDMHPVEIFLPNGSVKGKGKTGCFVGAIRMLSHWGVHDRLCFSESQTGMMSRVSNKKLVLVLNHATKKKSNE